MQSIYNTSEYRYSLHTTKQQTYKRYRVYQLGYEYNGCSYDNIKAAQTRAYHRFFSITWLTTLLSFKRYIDISERRLSFKSNIFTSLEVLWRLAAAAGRLLILQARCWLIEWEENKIRGDDFSTPVSYTFSTSAATNKCSNQSHRRLHLKYIVLMYYPSPPSPKTNLS